MAFFFERVLEIQSLRWSQIQADHFQDKYFLLNCFHFPSEVTSLSPQEASHTGSITPARSALEILSGGTGARPSLKRSESRYGSSLSHPQRCESQHFEWQFCGLQMVRSARRTAGQSFYLRVLFKSQMLGLRLQKLWGTFHFHQYSL